MNINPIRTDEDHGAALQEIDRLWGASSGTEDGDRLDILLVLVERYEEARWPIEASSWDPPDVLQYAIDEMGHSQTELGQMISPPRASEVLNRRRPLTVEMIHTISEKWKIPAELLVKPYKLHAHAA